LLADNLLGNQKHLAIISATTVKKHGCLLIHERDLNKAARTVTDTFTPRTCG
jgi:hypothetical protein